jgi:hypothetical protein
MQLLAVCVVFLRTRSLSAASFSILIDRWCRGKPLTDIYITDIYIMLRLVNPLKQGNNTIFH